MRRGRNKLKQRYGARTTGARRRRDLTPAVEAVIDVEPQHGSNLEAVEEHGHDWVTCRRCGRQWAITGTHAAVVTDGDGYCDEHPEDIAAAVRYYSPGGGHARGGGRRR